MLLSNLWFCFRSVPTFLPCPWLCLSLTLAGAEHSELCPFLTKTGWGITNKETSLYFVCNPTPQTYRSIFHLPTVICREGCGWNYSLAPTLPLLPYLCVFFALTNLSLTFLKVSSSQGGRDLYFERWHIFPWVPLGKASVDIVHRVRTRSSLQAIIFPNWIRKGKYTHHSISRLQGL